MRYDATLVGYAIPELGMERIICRLRAHHEDVRYSKERCSEDQLWKGHTALEPPLLRTIPDQFEGSCICKTTQHTRDCQCFVTAAPKSSRATKTSPKIQSIQLAISNSTLNTWNEYDR